MKRVNLSRKETVYLVILAVAVFHLVFSSYYFRLFHIDDPWVASLYYAQFKTGTYMSPIVHENNALTYTSFIMRNTVGLISNLFPDFYLVHRVLATMVALYTLLVFYLISFEITQNKLVAVKSVILLAFLEYFVQAAHTARPDIMTAAFVLTAFYIYLRFDTKAGYLIAGLVGGLAVEVHMIGMLSAVMIAGWEFSGRRFGRDRMGRYVLLVAGFLAAAGFWVLTHYRYFGAMIAQIEDIKYFTVETTIADRLLFLVNIGLQSKLFRDFLYLLMLLVTAVFIMVIGRRRRKRYMLTLIITFLVALASHMIIGRINRFYLIIYFPLVIVAFAWVTEERRLFKAAYIGVLAYMVLFWGYVFYRDGGAKFEPWVDRVYEASEPYLDKDTIVIGPSNVWYPFKYHTFHSYTARSPDVDRIIKGDKPVLLVSNALLETWLEEGREMGTLSGVTRFDKQELARYRKVGEVFDRHFGAFGLKKNNTTVIYFKEAQ